MRRLALVLSIVCATFGATSAAVAASKQEAIQSKLDRLTDEYLDQVRADAKALLGADETQRKAAADSLARIGVRAAPATPDLVAVLQKGDAFARAAAAQALGRIGRKASDAVPALIAALDDPDTAVKGEAIGALSAMGGKADRATPKMIALLKDDDAAVRDGASYALGRFGEGAVPMLHKALDNEDANVRDGAALAISRIGAPAKMTVKKLTVLLGDGNLSVRKHAAYALGRMNQDGAGAIPELTKAMRTDQDKDVRAVATFALVHVGVDPDTVAVPLVGLLSEANWDSRAAAASALRQLGRPVMPHLFEALKTADDPQARQELIWLIDDFGPPVPAQSVPVVRDLANHGDAKVRQLAEAVLKHVP